jgi:simple sugar transport system ATP-binding protein
MPVWRNFFLGSEKTIGWGPFKRLDVAFMKATSKRELLEMGIDLRDIDQPVGTLSGGERQCVAIARAVYFGAKVLILDEPTAALGVKQSGIVLRYIIQARDRGLGVVFITHNPHHAYPVGDRFLLLKRGQSIGYDEKSDISLEELTGLMSGGAELKELVDGLSQVGTSTDAVRTIRDEIEEDETAGVGRVAVTKVVRVVSPENNDDC